MGNPLFATKPLDTLMKEAADTGEHSLKRALGPVNLVTLGIGAIIASGWSSTLVAFLQDYGISLPPQICDVPGAQWAQYHGRWAPVSALGLTPDQLAPLPHATASFNLVAFLAILGVTAILIVGIKESANFNSAVVFVKLAAVLTFIAVALPFVLKNPHIAHETWKVFLPPNTGAFGSYGWSGVRRGADCVFFSYIGFDAFST